MIVGSVPFVALTSSCASLRSDGQPWCSTGRSGIGQHGRPFTLKVPLDARSRGSRQAEVDTALARSRARRSPGHPSDPPRRAAAALLETSPRRRMSFVGPRLERLVFVEALALRSRPTTTVTPSIPAITGWAQVPLPLLTDSIESANERASLRPVLHQAPIRRVRPGHRRRHGQDHPVPCGGHGRRCLNTSIGFGNSPSR